MKPTCKSEARWVHWRSDWPSVGGGGKFTHWDKRLMARARRRSSREIIEEGLGDWVDWQETSGLMKNEA